MSRWTEVEDDILTTFVEEYAAGEKINWALAPERKGLESRSTKQCRERFLSCIDPLLTKGPLQKE